MHDRSRFSEIDMAASLPREEQAPFRPSTLFAEAAHVDQYVNRRYCEHLLMAIEDQAAALGLAFTKAPGTGPAQLSSEDVAALEQAWSMPGISGALSLSRRASAITTSGARSPRAAAFIGCGGSSTPWPIGTSC